MPIYNSLCGSCGHINQDNSLPNCSLCGANLTNLEADRHGGSPNSSNDQALGHPGRNRAGIYVGNTVIGTVVSTSNFSNQVNGNSCLQQFLGFFFSLLILAIYVLLLFTFLYSLANYLYLNLNQIVKLLIIFLMVVMGSLMMLGLHKKISFDNLLNGLIQLFSRLILSSSNWAFSLASYCFNLGMNSQPRVRQIPGVSIRVLYDNINYVEIQVRGDISGGYPNVGDEIEVHGRNNRGTIQFASGRNITSGAEIRINRSL